MKKNKKPLIQTNEISKSTGKNMKVRIFSGLVLVLICLPIALVGSWPFFALIGVLAGFSIYEVIRVPRREKMPKLLAAALFIFGFILLYWPFTKNVISDMVFNEPSSIIGAFSNNNIDKIFEVGFVGSDYGSSSILISTPIIAVGFIFMFLTTISDEKFTIKDVFYYFGMAIILSLGFQGFYYLRYLPFAYSEKVLGNGVIAPNYYDNGFNEFFGSAALFMYVVVGTMITDIGAYFFGVLFGKHKMNPRVSPKKTWEGFAGGIVVSVVVSVSYVFIIDACGGFVLPGVLDIEHWYWVLLLSIAMPLIGNLGDLAFSAIKRDYEIKDYGNIIPGHGGVLDRLDSLIFSMATVAILLMFICNGWEIFHVALK